MEVHLRGNCQLHSGFFYDKKSRVGVSDETQNFKTNIFNIFICRKKLIMQVHSMEKCLS